MQAPPRESHSYYVPRADGKWKLRTASIPVPVDQSGAASHARYRCIRCKEFEWVALAAADKYDAANAAPTHDRCNRRMQRVEIPHPTAIPYLAMVQAVRPYLWSLAALAVVAVAGAATHTSRVHPAALAVLGGFAAWAATRWWRARLTSVAEAGNLLADDGMPEKIARDARVVGYTIAAVFGWLTYTCAVGVDPNTLAGLVAWPALVALWLPPAATWWRHTRNTRNLPPPAAPVREEEPVDDRDPDLAYVEWLIRTSLIQTAGEDVPADPPAPVTAREAVA